MIGRILGVSFGLLGAASFSQLPEFTQQYTQRLGGAVDELVHFVAEFDTDAAQTGLSRVEALKPLYSRSPFKSENRSLRNCAKYVSEVQRGPKRSRRQSPGRNG